MLAPNISSTSFLRNKMNRIHPIALVLAILCAIYTVVFVAFIITHPHAFDCADRIICE